MIQTPAQILRKLIEDLQFDTKIAILTQDNPDPDAMGAALGITYLAQKLNPELPKAEIFYGGAISHPQNRTMVNILGLKIKKMKQFAPSEYDLIVLVDVSSTGKKNLQSTNVVPHVIIDHHRDDPDGEYKLKDIRQVGAASSLVASYIMEYEDLNIETEDNGLNNFALIATALLVGIKTDTNELTSSNVTGLDFRCYEFLLKHADRKKLNQIINYSIPPYVFQLKAEAFRAMEIKYSVAVAGLGIIPASQRDGIAIISEELQRMEGIETVVAYAVIDDKLNASVRTSNDGIEMNSFCHQIFGEEHSGGKLGCGGASVPLGFLAPVEQSEGAREQIWEAVRAVVNHRVFKVASSS